MKLSEHFTLEEFIKSDTADKNKIDNTPTKEAKENIQKLVTDIMQPIRDLWEDSIIITSGYRCKELNEKVGGSKTSAHLYGMACDFQAKDKSKNKDLFELIKSMIDLKRITVGQLIWEYGTKDNPNWIHVSLEGNKHNQILYLGIK